MTSNPLVVACTSSKIAAVTSAWNHYPPLLEQRTELVIVATEIPSQPITRHSWNNDYSHLMDIAKKESTALLREARRTNTLCDYAVGMATGVILHAIEPPGRQTPMYLSLAVIQYQGATFVGFSPSFVISARLQEEREGIVEKATGGQFSQEMFDSLAITMALSCIVSPEWYKLPKE